MKRYETDVRCGILHLETDDGWIEIGSMDELYEILGETYTLEYNERERAMTWLDTDEDGTLTFDVGETLADTDYDREFVDHIESVSMEETDEDGYPMRTAVFASMMREIWDAKGDL